CRVHDSPYSLHFSHALLTLIHRNLSCKRVASGRSGTMGELLNNVRIASPCSADWEKMVGDERVRHCNQCNLNVYNLSALSSLEAHDLVAKREGRLCVRFYH